MQNYTTKLKGGQHANLEATESVILQRALKWNKGTG